MEHVDQVYLDIDDELAGLLNAVADACSRIIQQADKLRSRQLEKVSADIVYEKHDENTKIPSYYIVEKYKVPSVFVRDLKRILNEQVNLQVLLVALLSALYRRFNSEKFRDKMKSGGESAINLIGEWSRENSRWIHEKVYQHAERLKTIMEQVREHTDYFASSRKIDPDFVGIMALLYTAALNVNRWLLNDTLNLIKEVKDFIENQQYVII